MREVYSALEGTDHIRQVVVEVGAVGACAEGDAVVRIVDHLHHAKDVFLIDDDSGETEYAPSGIVGVNCHSNAAFFGNGDDLLQESFLLATSSPD